MSSCGKDEEMNTNIRKGGKPPFISPLTQTNVQIIHEASAVVHVSVSRPNPQ